LTKFPLTPAARCGPPRAEFMQEYYYTNFSLHFCADCQLDFLPKRWYNEYIKRKEVDTMKKKTYRYENRTFEVEVYSELCGSMLMIYIDEVIHPNRKFFGRTKYFYADDVIIDKYSSIDEAVKTVIAEGLEVEAYRKEVNEKWEEWNKETN
jgi:hypothetical protein